MLLRRFKGRQNVYHENLKVAVIKLLLFFTFTFTISLSFCLFVIQISLNFTLVKIQHQLRLLFLLSKLCIKNPTSHLKFQQHRSNFVQKIVKVKVCRNVGAAGGDYIYFTTVKQGRNVTFIFCSRPSRLASGSLGIYRSTAKIMSLIRISRFFLCRSLFTQQKCRDHIVLVFNCKFTSKIYINKK